MGAESLSFGEGVRLQTGDVTEVWFDRFGRALRNTVERDELLTEPVRVQAMR